MTETQQSPQHNETALELQNLVEAQISARVPETLPSDGIHKPVRGDGRCLISAVQHAATGYSVLSDIGRDGAGIPKDTSTEHMEQEMSVGALARYGLSSLCSVHEMVVCAV